MELAAAGGGGGGGGGGGVLWWLVTKAVTIFKNLFFHMAFYLTGILGHTQYAPTKTRRRKRKKKRKMTAQPSKDL